MKTYAVALAITALLVPSSPGWAQSQASLSSLMDKMDCVPFSWVAIGDNPKAAMTVPVIVDGTEQTFQLDTGAAYSVLSGPEGATANVRIGNFDLGNMHLVGLPNRQANTGTLGLDAFVGRAAVIDYPGERVCMSRLSDFPYAIYSRTTWVPGELRDGHFFVPVSLGTTEVDGVAFDTGASIVQMSFDHADWKRFTGLSSPADASVKVSGKSWGRDVTVVGEKVQGQLKIGSVALQDPTIYTVLEYPNFLAESKIRGLVGSAAFLDRVVILYIGTTPQLGFAH